MTLGLKNLAEGEVLAKIANRRADSFRIDVGDAGCCDGWGIRAKLRCQVLIAGGDSGVAQNVGVWVVSKRGRAKSLAMLGEALRNGFLIHALQNTARQTPNSGSNRAKKN